MIDRQVVKSLNRQVVAGPNPSGASDEKCMFSFEQLEVYKAARPFKTRVYALAKLLPDTERYRLCMQMRRAGLSLTNAISEGHGRHTYKDKRHYCHEARGSLQELIDDINDCIDNGHAKVEHLEDRKRDGFRVLQLIDGWARWLAAQRAKLTAKKPSRSRTSKEPALDHDSAPRLDDLTT